MTNITSESVEIRETVMGDVSMLLDGGVVKIWQGKTLIEIHTEDFPTFIHACIQIEDHASAECEAVCDECRERTN